MCVTHYLKSTHNVFYFWIVFPAIHHMTRVKEVRPELEDQRVSEFDVEAFLITIPSYKLPYLGRISTVAQSKIRRLVNRYYIVMILTSN